MQISKSVKSTVFWKNRKIYTFIAPQVNWHLLMGPKS